MIQARVRSGLRQVQVAGALGKSQSFVSKCERGDRRLDFPEFAEVADVLGVDIADSLPLIGTGSNAEI